MGDAQSRAKANLDPRVGPRVAPRVGPRVDPRMRPRYRPRERPRQDPRKLISLFLDFKASHESSHETSHEGVHGSAHENVQSSRRGSPVLFSPVLYVGHHTFSWGNSYGPMVLKVLLKFPLYTGIGPWMAFPVTGLAGTKVQASFWRARSCFPLQAPCTCTQYALSGPLRRGQHLLATTGRQARGLPSYQGALERTELR